MAFMRAYQRLSGDPFLASTHLISKRKQAGAGSRQKAFRKRSVRQLRLVQAQAMGDPFLGAALAAGVPAAVQGIGKLAGAQKGLNIGAAVKGIFGKVANVAKAALPGVGAVLQGGLPALANAKPMGGQALTMPDLGAMAGQLGFQPPSPGALKGLRAFGGKRRTMNVANVKALRRGIRRLEGFKSLVKRVDKMLPAPARTGVRPSRKRGRK